jgi:hypothetical protein
MDAGVVIGMNKIDRNLHIPRVVPLSLLDVPLIIVDVSCVGTHLEQIRNHFLSLGSQLFHAADC